MHHHPPSVRGSWPRGTVGEGGGQVYLGSIEDVFSSDFGQIAAILAIAAVVGGLATFFRQPLIVAYIVVGVIVGPAVFGLVTATEQVELLAKVGIAILLFLVGLKLDLHLIRSMGKIALLTGLGQVIFTSVVGFGIVLLLGFDVIAAIYIAVALTFSSTIIIVKLLSDKRELDELHGRIAVGFLIVQDLVVIIAMIAIVALGAPGEAGTGQQILTTVLGGIGFLVTVALLAKFVIPKLLDFIARSRELTLLFAVAWAVSLAFVSSALGLSMEVGAFVAGVALASTPYRDILGASLVNLRDILILFFFIELGASLTFANAIDQLGSALVLSAFVLIGNPLIVMVIMGVMGYQKKVSFKAGLVVAQISEFSLILIALGFSLGQVDEAVLSLVTMVGILTIAISTYLILYSEQIYQRIAPALSIFEKNSVANSPASEEVSHPYDAIVIGAGRFGGEIIRGLRDRGALLLVVDHDPYVLRSLRESGVETLYGDAGEPEFAGHLPLHETAAVICAVPDQVANLVLLESVRRLGFKGQVCLTALDDHAAEAYAGNADVHVMRPFTAAAGSVVKSLPVSTRTNSRAHRKP
jgi:Kef-type K+ transport system membrane component KefB